MPRNKANKQKQKKKGKKQQKKNNKKQKQNKQTTKKSNTLSPKWKKCLLPSKNQETDFLVSGFIRNIDKKSECPKEIVKVCIEFAQNILSVLNTLQCQSLIHHFVQKKIIKKKQKFECIFNAKMNGFDATSFHSKCDQKGPTLIAIRSNYHLIFGGFTNNLWITPSKGMSQYAEDYNAFLFSFDLDSDNLNVYDVDFNKAGLAIQNSENKGPIFGYSDIIISDKGNIEKTSFCKPSCYQFNGKKGNVLCGGNDDSVSDGYFRFAVDNYEVFELK